MKEMWRFNKKSSRILAGFLAMMLVFSNIAANVQTVYAAGPLFQIGGDGEVTPVDNGDELDGGTLDGMEIGAPADDEEEYDFHVSIWPEMEKIEDTEGEESDPEEAQEVWTGKWLQYMYDGQETDHTLGQELLMSDKYADEYGPLDMDLPGTWEGDNDEVMEVYPDGTALVKNEGTVNVTFTYEDEAITDSLEEDAPAEETETADLSEEKNTTGDDQAIDDLQTVDDETTETVTAGEEETEAETEAEDETETEAEAEVEDETEAEAETEVEDETEAEAETETEAETEVETEAEAETKTTVSAGVSTAAPENEKETEPAAVKKTKTAAPLEVGTASVKEKNMAGDGQTIGDPQTASDEPTADSETAGTITTAAKEAETEAESEAETEAETETEAEIETIVSTEVSAVALENEKETEPAAVKETKPAAPSKEETASGKEKNTAGDGQTIGDPQTAVDEPTADDETTETVTTAAEEAETEAESEAETETETEAETTAKAEVSTAAQKNRVRRPSRRAVKETEAEATESRTEEASEDRSDETESVPVATGSNAAKPEIHEAPEEEAEMELEPGTVLTWVVCVKYVGPALMAEEPLTDGILKVDQIEYHSLNVPVELIGGSHTVTVTGNWYGTIINTGTGTTTIGGTGTIDARGKGSAITVKDGTTVVLNGNVTVTGGTGTEVDHSGSEPRAPHTFNVGGGVYVKKGIFILDGATITGNTAQRGGGVFVDAGSNFTMKSGEISSNQTVNKVKGEDKYAGEGGGIYIFGDGATALITGGSIINNTCNSQTDLGGGGLYVNNGGKATLVNAIVTGNSADGWGGGIAGCGHGESSLVAVDGVALYGNTAKGEKKTAIDGEKGKTNNTKIDSQTIAGRAGITGDDAADFYSGGATIVSNYMIGGGSAKYHAKYGYYKDGVEANGAVIEIKDIADDEVIKYQTKYPSAGFPNDLIHFEYSRTALALKANPTEESISMIPKNNVVMISGNHSTVHGGGIGCNGSLYFGSTSEQNFEFYILNLTLNAKKQMEGGGNLTAGAYKFDLLYDRENGMKAATAQNDADGNIQFVLSDYLDISNHLKGDKITFYLKESIPTDGSRDPRIKYDKSVYKLVVTLSGPVDSSQTVTLSHQTSSNNKNDITVTYTKHTYSMQSISITKVKDNDGNPVPVNEPVVANTTPTFVNSMKATYTPNVEKTVTGPASSNATFEFKIVADASNREGGAVMGATTATVTGTGSASFGAITFTQPGTYRFTISETKGSESGYTYDESQWTLEVVVDNDYNVTAHRYAKVGGSDRSTEKATFNNIYTAPISYQPKVTKVVDGPTPEDKSFSFSITEKAGNPEGGAVLPSDKTATVTGSNSTTFNSITFTKAGTYRFEIRETQGNAKGYAYDGSVWTLTVEVADNNHVLSVTGHTYDKAATDSSAADSSTEQATFTNVYRITKNAEYSPEVKKEITGATPPDKKTFTFAISSTNGTPMPSAKTITVNGADTGHFGNIEYTAAGTYTYTINEVSGDAAGYSYDGSIWTLTVVVTDIDSELQAKGTYTKEDGTSSNEAATFINTYTVTETLYVPNVEKVITGVESWKDNQSEHKFNFSIAANKNYGANVTLPDPTEATVVISDSDNDGIEVGHFGEITFNAAGTYEFTISEMVDVPAGFTRDAKTWTLTVVVEDHDSILEVTSHSYQQQEAAESNQDKATFTNEYKVTSTDYAPKVTKEVTGEVRPDKMEDQRVWTDNKTFTFNIESYNAAAKNSTNVTMPGETSVKVEGTENGKVSSASFGSITFNRVGEYQFMITEVDSKEPGYDYDDHAWIMTVTVVDVNSDLKISSVVYEQVTKDSEGNVTKTGTSKEEPRTDDGYVDTSGSDYTVSAKFTNNYAVEPTTYAPEVMKIISGNAMPPEDRTYTFTLTAGDWRPNDGSVQVGAKLPDPAIATVVGAGRGTFGEIEFTKPGFYNFTIAEVDEGGSAGYIYDDTTWNVRVTVEDKDSKLAVTKVAYTKTAGSKTQNAGETKEGDLTEENTKAFFASFYNEYYVIPTETRLHVTKYVTGSVRPDNNVATFNFRLALIDATTRNGATLPEKQTVTITGSGDPGLLGTADFDPIKFTQAGTYIFEIDEMTGFETDTQTMPGYTYDSSTWKVSVEVEDHNGTLVVTKKEYNHLVNGERVDSSDVPEEEGAKFVNDYDVESTKYAPKVNKEFARSAAARPTEETFTFTMEPAADYGENITFSDAATAKEVTVTGAGIAAFDDITFNESGTYEFIISETDDSEKSGYTYDPVKWKLTVEVIDTGRKAEGANRSQLMVNTTSYVQIDTDEPKSAGGMATFTNDYQAKEGRYVPQVEKKLTGADRPTEKTFTFSILENGYTPPVYALALESGAVMPEKTEVTVTGEGTASFDEIRFTNAGIYSFLITENKGTDNGYTYDETAWNLTVTVEDIAGQLTVTDVVYESNGTEADKAGFTNDYEVTATEYAPGVKKTVLGNPLEEEQFNFTMESGEGNDAEGFAFAEGDIGRQVTVNGAGTGKFGGITFKKAGTYTFKIKETSSNSPFWADDDRTWTLTVVVEDEDSKLVVKSHTYVRDGEDSVTSDTEAEFENEFHGPGDLSISKTVSGNRGEMTRAFNFIVTFTNLKGEPLAGTYEYAGSSTVEGVEAPADGSLSGGVLNITLAHGQKITIKGIPADTKYTVTETEADTEEYQTSVEVNGDRLTGDEAVGEVVRDTETVVEYLNYRNRSGGTTPGGPGPGPDSGPGPGPGPDTGSGPDSGPDSGPGPSPEFELITDEPTPLSSFKNLENIEDEDVPLAFLAPMTGDNKPVGAAALFGLVALGVMGAFGIKAFKKDEDDKH